MRWRDPLADPAPLIRRVYSYVAYRIGDGPDAEDVTSEVFERALRYRASYDGSRGKPLPWLLGIARRCADDALARRPPTSGFEVEEHPSGDDVEEETMQRLQLAAALATLDVRGRDLIALRYGADLSARQIGELLGLKTNAVEVALHRVLARVRAALEEPGPTLAESASDEASSRIAREGAGPFAQPD
jgi:RNA polymerase sigma factor (sigma-70 family)